MVKHSSSSSSEGDALLVDEKKRKRMLSNRESARRSRKRREEHIKDLNSQITFFRNNNSEIAKKVNSISQKFTAVELENRRLTRVRDELTKRLESLEIVSSYVCGNPEDLPQYNSSQPWILSQQSMPLIASAGMSRYWHPFGEFLQKTLPGWCDRGIVNNRSLSDRCFKWDCTWMELCFSE